MRLFVALDLRVEIRQDLDDLIASLKLKSGSANKVRWARPEGLHVTLKFIGHAIDRADTAKFASVSAALGTIRSDAPVEMHFRGVGVFPDAQRPRVLYCGVEASGNLAQLAADIERALKPIGVPSEERKFVPHLTLARFSSRRDNSTKPEARKRDAASESKSRGTPGGTSGGTSAGINDLIRAASEMASRDFGSARETQFHLFESILKPGGSQYRKIETFSFWKEAA